MKKWKYIEIVNELEIKEIFHYVHPSYEFQYVYINSDSNLMIERLLFSKAYLYKKVSLDDKTIRWQIIKKIENFDRELEGDLNDLSFYSPDFSQNLELDRRSKTFLVRDTFTS